MDLDDTIKGVAEMIDKEPKNALWNYSLRWLLDLKSMKAEMDKKMVKAYKLGYSDAMKECNKSLSETVNRFEKVFED